MQIMSQYLEKNVQMSFEDSNTKIAKFLRCVTKKGTGIAANVMKYLMCDTFTELPALFYFKARLPGEIHVSDSCQDKHIL